MTAADDDRCPCCGDPAAGHCPECGDYDCTEHAAEITADQLTTFLMHFAVLVIAYRVWTDVLMGRGPTTTDAVSGAAESDVGVHT